MEGDGYRAMKRLLTVRPRIEAVFVEGAGRRAAELLLNGLDLDHDPPPRVVVPPRSSFANRTGRSEKRLHRHSRVEVRCASTPNQVAPRAAMLAVTCE